MIDLEGLNEAIGTLTMLQEQLTAAADTMPTIEAGDVVAGEAEALAPIVERLNAMLARLQGQDPGDTSAADTAITDSAA